VALKRSGWGRKRQSLNFKPVMYKSFTFGKGKGREIKGFGTTKRARPDRGREAGEGERSHSPPVRFPGLDPRSRGRGGSGWKNMVGLSAPQGWHGQRGSGKVGGRAMRPRTSCFTEGGRDKSRLGAAKRQKKNLMKQQRFYGGTRKARGRPTCRKNIGEKTWVLGKGTLKRRREGRSKSKEKREVGPSPTAQKRI